jgi:hypothetical protein
MEICNELVIESTNTVAIILQGVFSNVIGQISSDVSTERNSLMPIFRPPIKQYTGSGKRGCASEGNSAKLWAIMGSTSSVPEILIAVLDPDILIAAPRHGISKGRYKLETKRPGSKKSRGQRPHID